ncbi:MAG: PHP domain-containing protein [Chlamydia sp.]
MSQRGVDLHVHSNFSDGVMSPGEIADHALQLQLEGIAITDHDTISSWNTLSQEASLRKLVAIPGVELSSELHNESIHVLGYAFRPNSQILREACLFHSKRRETRNREIINRLTRLGMAITYEEVLVIAPSSHTIGRPHIAQVLLKKGYVSNVQDAFKRYLGSKKSCYIAGDRWRTEEAIDLIHQAGGYAILAHPHLISRFKRVEELLKLPFDGLEGYYASFSERDNQPFISYAESKGLFLTGGSDFHGAVKPRNSLGSSTTPKKTIDAFLSRMRDHG